MNIEIYADGADHKGIIEAAKNEKITGFTTNPTLMKAAGVTDYKLFAQNIISDLKLRRPDTNISLEVFADDTESMYIQAKKIKSWGDDAGYDVFVKIPVMNTKGEHNYGLVEKLSAEGVKVNVTAIFTPEQTHRVLQALDKETPAIVSIFAGRIADAGVDPEWKVTECMRKNFEYPRPHAKFLWASTREVFNLIQADRIGCDIITMTHDQIKKLSNLGKDLTQFSQETVQMFYNDAVSSGFNID
jgi:transaldolase